jgi:hypothetical protein
MKLGLIVWLILVEIGFVVGRNEIDLSEYLKDQKEELSKILDSLK